MCQGTKGGQQLAPHNGLLQALACLTKHLLYTPTAMANMRFGGNSIGFSGWS